MDDQDICYINPDLLFEATTGLSNEDIEALLHDIARRLSAGETEGFPHWVRFTEPTEGVQ